MYVRTCTRCIYSSVTQEKEAGEGERRGGRGREGERRGGRGREGERKGRNEGRWEGGSQKRIKNDKFTARVPVSLQEYIPHTLMF